MDVAVIEFCKRYKIKEDHTKLLIQMMVDGKSLDEMAEAIGKHKRIIGSYFSGLYDRTGFNSRYQVTAAIYRDAVDNKRVKELELKLAEKESYIRELELSRADYMNKVKEVQKIVG